MPPSSQHAVSEVARRPAKLRLFRLYATDAELFLRLEQNLGATRLYHPVGTHAEALREIRRTRLYLLKLGETVAGTIAYRRRKDGSVEISNLAVQPAHRRHGLARAAMEHLLAAQRLAPHLDLVTHPENEAALGLYLSLGFRVQARLENCFGDGEPRLRLVRSGVSRAVKPAVPSRTKNS